jgi:hypothetical protein
MNTPLILIFRNEQYYFSEYDFWSDFLKTLKHIYKALFHVFGAGCSQLKPVSCLFCMLMYIIYTAFTCGTKSTMN